MAWKAKLGAQGQGIFDDPYLLIYIHYSTVCLRGTRSTNMR